MLAALDYVVVSVHGSFSLPEAEMTRRLIRAVENPYVTMLGHLTGRLLLEREAYAVDIPAVLDRGGDGHDHRTQRQPLAAGHGLALVASRQGKGGQMRHQPRRAHARRGLQDLWFGVAQARKGWLTRADVVNCLPLGQVEAALAAKREKLASPPG